MTEDEVAERNLRGLRALVGRRDLPMSFQSFQGVEELERRGRLDMLPPEMLEAYSQFKAARDAAAEEIIRNSGSSHLTVPTSGQATGGKPADSVEEDEDTAILRAVAGTMVEVRQHGERSAELLAAVAQSLQNAEDDRRQADERAATQTKVNSWLGWTAAALTAISTISVFPVLIDFWRHIFG